MQSSARLPQDDLSMAASMKGGRKTRPPSAFAMLPVHCPQPSAPSSLQRVEEESGARLDVSSASSDSHVEILISGSHFAVGRAQTALHSLMRGMARASLRKGQGMQSDTRQAASGPPRLDQASAQEVVAFATKESGPRSVPPPPAPQPPPPPPQPPPPPPQTPPPPPTSYPVDAAMDSGADAVKGVEAAAPGVPTDMWLDKKDKFDLLGWLFLTFHILLILRNGSLGRFLYFVFLL